MRRQAASPCDSVRLMPRASAAWILSMCLAIAATTSCNSGGSSDGASAPASLLLEVAGGEAVDEVPYVISGNGIDPIAGVIDTSASGATASVEVFGIPPGTEYDVSMSVTGVASMVSCEGSTTFDVEQGQVSEVYVYLNCKADPRYGGLRVNGSINLCATLEEVVIAPLQTSIGNRIDLRAEAMDLEGDAIAYTWTTSSGEIDRPHDSATHYTCAEVGEHTIEVTVSDDPLCLDTWTVPVSCVDRDAGCEGPEPCWGTSEDISKQATKWATVPQVGSDAAGNAIAVWMQVDDDPFVESYGIWASRYTPTESWDNPEQISNARADATRPHIALDSAGNAIAVWSQFPIGGPYVDSVWANRYTQGAGWEGAIEIDDNPTWAAGADIAMNADGLAMVVWRQHPEGDADESIWGRPFSPQEGWGIVGPVEASPLVSSNDPRVAVDASGNATAIWWRQEEHRNVWGNRFDTVTGWGAAQQLDDPSTDSLPAEVAMSRDGNALAVWTSRFCGSTCNVWAAWNTAAEGWSAREAIKDDGLSSKDVEVAFDTAGLAMVLWSQSANIWNNRYVPGDGWGAAELVRQSERPAAHPSLGFDTEGNAIAVWLEAGGGQWAVHAAGYTPTEGWGPSERIDQATYVVQTPDLAVSASGKAAAVWAQRSDGSSGQRIWANQYE